MKTDTLDFLLSSFVLGMLVFGSTIIIQEISPFSRHWLGDYYILANSLFFLLCFGLLTALVTRLLLIFKPLAAGNYAMNENIFIYWKLLTVIHEFGRGALLPFTPVFARPLVAMLFGAKTGTHIAIGGRIADPSLITIGDNAILGHNSVITPHAITDGRIILCEVKIGRGATIGVNAVIMAGVEIGEGSVVAASAVLPPFAKVPDRELWGGIPARKIKKLEDSDIRS